MSESQGNMGHKRCKYCNVDNWHHATLDCPGIGPPIPANRADGAYTIASYNGPMNRSKQVVDNTIALWCSAGEHAFSAGDDKKQILTRVTEESDRYGDTRVFESKYAICGKHANGLFGAADKSHAPKGEIATE